MTVWVREPVRSWDRLRDEVSVAVPDRVLVPLGVRERVEVLVPVRVGLEEAFIELLGVENCEGDTEGEDDGDNDTC